jgi:antitoxin CptB
VTVADDNEMARLRWRCRRGLLELDLVFNDFVDRGYRLLDTQMQQAFWDLLEESDNPILAWLHGTDSCEDNNLKQIIKIIREDIDYKDKKITDT